jgi:hypothetical protein
MFVGALLGVIGAFLQAQRLVIEQWGFSIPWGAIVACIGILIVIRGAVVGAGTRWAGWGVILGWLGASIALSAESPSGDIAISSGVRQMTYLVTTVILGAMLATLPPRLRNPRSSTHVGA